MNPSALLEAQKLSLTIGTKKIFSEIDLALFPGQLHVLLGPSGSGKSSLLKTIAGFHFPSSGTVFLSGKNVGHLLPEQRGTPLVFQDTRLFPHLSVKENIAFGMTLRGRRFGFDRKTIQEKTQFFLERFQLEELSAFYPAQISGGQAQRVALARALATQPRVLLLDEPLSGLDAKLKTEIQSLLLEFKNKSGLALLWVTHDQAEALSLADHISLIHEGRRIQTGTPHELYESPASPWAARFLGGSNIISWNGRQLMIKPEDLRIAKPSDAPPVFRGALTRLEFQGATTLLSVRCPELSCSISDAETTIQVRLPSVEVKNHDLRVGLEVALATRQGV